jgi:hypothetical protein
MRRVGRYLCFFGYLGRTDKQFGIGGKEIKRARSRLCLRGKEWPPSWVLQEMRGGLVWIC